MIASVEYGKTKSEQALLSVIGRHFIARPGLYRD